MPAQTRIIHYYVCLGAAGGKECEVIMKEKYIKNLPSTCTSLFLIILMYCTRFLSISIRFPGIILITLLFIVPVQMDKFSSKKSKKGWTIAYIVFAIIELIIAIIL